MEKVKDKDIYQVGENIIACGDSLDKDFVKRVVSDKKIRTVVTDPPYGVAYVKNKKDIVDIATPKEIAGDHTQTEYEYSRFTQGWIEAIIPYLAEYNTFHIFNSDLMFLALRVGMNLADVHFSQMLIWLKNQAVMGRMDYLPQQELIAYGWYKKHKRERSQSKSLIIHPRPQKSNLHPTQKPIGLLRKIIPSVTKTGEYVYDGFLGSGSTAIASVQLGRLCIGIEKESDYVEICLQRLEKLNGKQRKLISNYGKE